MKIIQVQLKTGQILSLGDKIIVEYKPLVGKEGEEEESETPVIKEITIGAFRPFDDESEEIWIVDQNGQIYSESDYRSIKLENA